VFSRIIFIQIFLVCFETMPLFYYLPGETLFNAVRSSFRSLLAVRSLELTTRIYATSMHLYAKKAYAKALNLSNSEAQYL
jgi:hypothetical protein